MPEGVQGLVLTTLASLEGSALFPLVLPAGQLLPPSRVLSSLPFTPPLEPQLIGVQRPDSTRGLAHSAGVGFGARENKVNIFISFAEGFSIPEARSESLIPWITKKPPCYDEKNSFWADEQWCPRLRGQPTPLPPTETSSGL